MKVDKEVEKLIKPKSEPKIYAFKIPEIRGATKIGETTRDVDVRLSEWQNNYPNLKYVNSWSSKIDKDGDVVYFRDISIHKYLENIKNRERLQNDIFENKKLHYSNEFFWDRKNKKDFKNLMDDIDDAIKAITDNYKENNGDGYDYYKADLRELVDDEPTHDKTYPLRNNQKSVVDKFKSAVKKGEHNLLMYAVMRFGKSFTAMNCALELKNERKNKPIYIVIVSGYKDVGDEWRNTIYEHKNFGNMEFISSLKKRRSEDSIKKLLKKGKDVVLFTTLQALNNYNRKDKDNEDILVKPVDLLIVDETHFAARGEKDGRVLRDNEDEEENYGTIEEAEQTIDKISLKSKNTITMHLSGTPYRILMGDEFNDNQIIAKVGYNDILKSKDDWDEKNRENIKTEYPDNGNIMPQDALMPWNNDYFGFPQMLRFGFNLNESSIEKLKSVNADYSLNELFNTKSKTRDQNGNYKKFKNASCVKDLLMAIDGSEYEDPNVFGMLNYEKIRENDMCKHIVMVLPYRSSCDALEKMLEDNKKKEGFANLSKYDVINIAGLDSNFRSSNAEKDIKNCIASKERTISLTVKKMLVGVTVPQWDTMIYLKNTKSPQEYDQAIYRLQSPYIKKYKDENGYECQVCEKEQTILVDFDLHRLFELQEQNAEMALRRDPEQQEMSLDKIKDSINEDIKYSPIICVNKNKLSKIEPTDIVSKIFDYDSRKSITDLVNEMLIDPLIFKSEKLSKYFKNENSIKSKKGLVVSASSSDDDGKDIDIDENDNANEENRQGNNPDSQEQHTDTEDEKEGKYRSKISKILFYAYFTNDTVCSLKDLIDKSNSEENKRILKHIKLEKGFLMDLYKECLSSSSETLVSLDVNISKMNLYSKDKSMETTEKILTRFSRLGDSTVLSPKEVVEKIIYNIPDGDFNDIDENNKILDIASTAAEFAPTYVERMRKIGKTEETIKNSIVTIPKDGLCYELAKKVYENLGLNVDNIATFYATELSEMIRSNQTSNEKIVQVLNNAKCPINQIKITDFQAE